MFHLETVEQLCISRWLVYYAEYECVMVLARPLKVWGVYKKNIKNHQNINIMNLNLKALRISVLATMAMILSAGFMLASNPTGNETATNRLQEQVQTMFDDTGYSTDVNGKAVVTFQVTEDNRIEVIKVLADNPDLISHVEETLEGQSVKNYGLEHNQKIRFNLSFNYQK